MTFPRSAQWSQIKRERKSKVNSGHVTFPRLISIASIHPLLGHFLFVSFPRLEKLGFQMRSSLPVRTEREEQIFIFKKETLNYNFQPYNWIYFFPLHNLWQVPMKKIKSQWFCLAKSYVEFKMKNKKKITIWFKLSDPWSTLI